MIAVFDTNIIIDALNGIEKASQEYNRYDEVLISRITWMEVLVGAEDNDLRVREFLESRFKIIPLDVWVAEKAIQVRRENHLRIPDAIIWATALTYDALFVTRNTKDFKVDWPGVYMPYQLETKNYELFLYFLHFSGIPNRLNR